jgi:hypothetical protein
MALNTYLPVEAVSRSSVRQHRDREIRIRQNPQTSLLGLGEKQGQAVVALSVAIPWWITVQGEAAEDWFDSLTIRFYEMEEGASPWSACRTT